ncbi:50S ribosomal protein L3 [bacterium]|nr:50S ribosomal protein L3 [bacterium]
MVKVLFAEKIGMSQSIDESGVVTPVTIMQVLASSVVREDSGVQLIGVGVASKKANNKAWRGQFKALSFCPSFIKGVQAPADDLHVGLPAFSVGDEVSVRSRSKGRGFTGTIARHGFKRGPMSHGSKSHRIPGSIGAGTTPGRVLKGTRMAGRSGGGFVTVKGLKVVATDVEKGLIVLSGSVPGKNGWVQVLGG